MGEPFKVISLESLTANENIQPRNGREFIYEAFKLNKKMGKRYNETKTIDALDSVDGLEIILQGPEKNNSFLHSMDESVISQCDFLIVATMYNEKAKLFFNTLSGICNNLQKFENYERVACIVIVDGIEAFLESFNRKSRKFANKYPGRKNDISSRFFSQFFDIDSVINKFYPENGDIKKCQFPGQQESDEFAHCFTHKVFICDNQNPLNLVFCVKQFNKRKLNSHLWFFGGFCQIIQPKFVMLIDIGTVPRPRSLYYLYKALDNDKQLAGCCGEIVPNDCKFMDILTNAQAVEYKFAHLFDKALESVIGYITVLPGAFSAYRWEALKGPPLWDDYFKSICHPELMNAFQLNIYLAEDRVLCLSLITKESHNYTLRYVKQSIAETDVPNKIGELLSQRRRWINGSWFALIDTIRKAKRLRYSTHSYWRIIFFYFQIFYYVITVIYAWFIVGIYTLTLCILLYENLQEKVHSYIQTALISGYIILLLLILITSLGVKPKYLEKFFMTMACVMGLYQILIIYLGIDLLIKKLFLDDINDSLIEAKGFDILVLILGYIIVLMPFLFTFVIIINWNLETLLKILKGIIQYILLIPTYMSIFFIYAICNVCDLTWGNRPDNLTSEEKERTEEFKEFRARWVLFWIFCNVISAYFPYEAYKADPIFTTKVIFVLGIPGASLVIFKVLGGIIYIFVESCCGNPKKNNAEHNRNQRVDLILDQANRN